jgi:pimeloyl-ACP methyl ester carboxylesterase
MRRLLWLLLGLLILLAVALPWLRSVEHADLSAAQAQAPGAFVTLQHGKVFYRVAGPANGAPVILVHGFSVPDFIFDGTRRQLADAGFHVISLDLYGRGWSDRPDVVYDRDLFAGQLGQLMDALNIKRASLVGISMGGAVVGHFAAAHADRVDKLVLIDPFTQPFDIGPMRWPVIGDWYFYSFYLPHLQATLVDGSSHPEHAI